MYDVDNIYRYHAPTGTQVGVYQGIRDLAKRLAVAMCDYCPECRERSEALNCLESAVMWANASIARNPGVESPKVTREKLEERLRDEEEAR